MLISILHRTIYEPHHKFNNNVAVLTRDFQINRDYRGLTVGCVVSASTKRADGLSEGSEQPGPRLFFFYAELNRA